MRVQNYIFAGALYSQLPIVCIAFLFESVTSSSASKCSYYQSSVNTLSKVMYSVLFQNAHCQTAVRLSKCANSIVIRVYLCFGRLQCALKYVLACRIYNIISSSSFLWFYRVVRTLTARTMLVSIWVVSTVTFFKVWGCQPHAETLWSRDSSVRVTMR